MTFGRADASEWPGQQSGEDGQRGKRAGEKENNVTGAGGRGGHQAGYLVFRLGDAVAY